MGHHDVGHFCGHGHQVVGHAAVYHQARVVVQAFFEQRTADALVYRCAKQQPESVPPKRSPAHCLWAALIARIYEVFPLLCPVCGGQMRLIAFITEGAQIRKILEHIGVAFDADERVNW